MRGGERAGAVLDANVLYAALIRDVLLRLAAADLFRPYWSERIHDEWTRNLLAHRRDLSPARIARTRATMDAHFPSALVAGHDAGEEAFGEVAREDQHVAATAQAAGAGYIVTQKVRDFPADALRPHVISAVTADDFVRLLRTPCVPAPRWRSTGWRSAIRHSIPKRTGRHSSSTGSPPPPRSSGPEAGSQSVARPSSNGSSGTSRGPFSSHTA